MLAVSFFTLSSITRLAEASVRLLPCTLRESHLKVMLGFANVSRLFLPHRSISTNFPFCPCLQTTLDNLDHCIPRNSTAVSTFFYHQHQFFLAHPCSLSSHVFPNE